MIKKNNIGIITFHASLNCGSMLQAFALQNILEKKYNQNVEIINYSNFGQRNYYSNWDFFPKKSIFRCFYLHLTRLYFVYILTSVSDC